MTSLTLTIGSWFHSGSGSLVLKLEVRLNQLLFILGSESGILVVTVLAAILSIFEALKNYSLHLGIFLNALRLLNNSTDDNKRFWTSRRFDLPVYIRN